MARHLPISMQYLDIASHGREKYETHYPASGFL